MSRSIYYNGQYVNADDLNNTESTSIDRVKNFTQLWLGDSSGYQGGSASISAGGVLGSPLDYLETGRNLYPAKSSTSEIVVAAGDAVDLNGELIHVDQPQTVVFGQSTDVYAWPTGSIGARNYVKIAYKESSGSFGYDRLDNKEPKRYTASYYITVDTIYPASDEVLLGTFTPEATTGRISGDISDKRLYVAVIAPSEGVLLDPMETPIASHATFYDHVQAVGGGTPSATNPHGLTYTDLSAAPAGTVLTLSLTSSGSVLPNVVYENTNPSVYYVDTVILEAYQHVNGDFSREMYLQIGSSGSTGSGGSLTGTTYDISYFRKQCVSAGGNYDDVLDVTTSIRSFIPSDWFWKVSSKLGGWDSGSIEYSVQHE